MRFVPDLRVRSRAGAENSELEKSVSNALYRIRRKLRKELEREE